MVKEKIENEEQKGKWEDGKGQMNRIQGKERNGRMDREKIENEEQKSKGKGKGQMDRKQGQEGSGRMDGGKDRKRETGKWEDRK